MVFVGLATAILDTDTIMVKEVSLKQAMVTWMSKTCMRRYM